MDLSVLVYILPLIALLYGLQIANANFVLRNRLANALITDSRIGLLSNLLHGIRSIKSYMWQEPAIKAIKKTRRRECLLMLWRLTVTSFSGAIFQNSQYLLWVPLFCVPLAQGQPLAASKIFTACSVISSLSRLSVFLSSNTLTSASQYYAVLKRIEGVLLLKDHKLVGEDLPPPAPLRLQVESLTAVWSD